PISRISVSVSENRNSVDVRIPRAWAPFLLRKASPKMILGQFAAREPSPVALRNRRPRGPGSSRPASREACDAGRGFSHVQIAPERRRLVGIGRYIPRVQHPRLSSERSVLSCGPDDQNGDCLPRLFPVLCDRAGAEDEVDTALAVAQVSVPALDGRAR